MFWGLDDEGGVCVDLAADEREGGEEVIRGEEEAR